MGALASSSQNIIFPSSERLAGAICKVVIIQWRQDRSRGLFAWVKTPGFNEHLPSSWLDAVLDLTGSVDGELADEGEQGLGNDLDYGGACVLAGFSLLPLICIIAASLLS